MQSECIPSHFFNIISHFSYVSTSSFFQRSHLQGSATELLQFQWPCFPLGVLVVLPFQLHRQLGSLDYSRHLIRLGYERHQHRRMDCRPRSTSSEYRHLGTPPSRYRQERMVAVHKLYSTRRRHTSHCLVLPEQPDGPQSIRTYTQHG